MDKSAVTYKDVESKVITLRNTNVIIDRDVAALYGVETREVNQAVKNNPDKFPDGYIFNLQTAETQQLVENFDRFATMKHSISNKAFTEKGLYMLATILKSEKAAQTTIAIIETFAKVRELARTVTLLQNADDNSEKKSLLKRSGELIGEVMDENLELTGSETEIELNFAVLKVKHTIKRTKKTE